MIFWSENRYKVIILALLLLPITAQDSWKIYRGDAQLSGRSDSKIASSYQLAWTFVADDKIKSSPVISDSLVYITSIDGRLQAVNLHTGQLDWVFTSEYGFEAPPLVIGDQVLVGSLEGRLFAIDKMTGSRNWDYLSEGQIVGSVNSLVNVSDDEKLIFFGSYDNYLYCLEARSGTLKWRYETTHFINGTPATDGKTIFFGGCDGILHFLDINTGTERNAVNLEYYIAGSPALIEDRLFIGHYGGVLFCIDMSGNIIWQHGDSDNSAPIVASPAVDEIRVIYGARDFNVYCLNRNTGKPIWTFKTQGNIDGSAVIGNNGKVVFGSGDGYLYIVDLLDGSLIWSTDLGTPIISSPALIDDYLLITSQAGVLYAFRNSE